METPALAGPPAAPPAPGLCLPAESADAAGPALALGPVVLVMLLQLRPGRRLAGWWRFITAAWRLRRVPGLRWIKVLGSGHEGGFGLQPSLSRHGYLAVFEDAASARAFRESAFWLDYDGLTLERAWIELHPLSSRGRWSGREMPVASSDPVVAEAAPSSYSPPSPLASLTRASIRPLRAWRFWRHSPPSEAALARASGCLLAVGLGEAPVLRQATFSIWRSEADLMAYARGGAHRRAIEAAYGEGYFSESLFARLRPLDAGGLWRGQPLWERLWGHAETAVAAPPGAAAGLPAVGPRVTPSPSGVRHA